MAYEPPPDAFCAQHPDTRATSLCPRCGNFACAACEKRTRPDAVPMCPACWERRTAVVEPHRRARTMLLPNTVLGLGVLGLVPFLWPVQGGAIVIGLVALSRLDATAETASAAKKRIVIGMACGALGLAITVLSFAVGFGAAL